MWVCLLNELLLFPLLLPPPPLYLAIFSILMLLIRPGFSLYLSICLSILLLGRHGELSELSSPGAIVSGYATLASRQIYPFSNLAYTTRRNRLSVYAPVHCRPA